MSTGVVDTMLPVQCEMGGCSNAVEAPSVNTIVVSIGEGTSITIACCQSCRNRLNAPSDFYFYSMN